MNRGWIPASGVMFLSLAFVGDLLPTDLHFGSVSSVFSGSVGTSEGPTKAQACERAVQVAVDKTSTEHQSEITDKSCSCSQRASSVETWSCVASVSWNKH